ncbi:MAG: hypothetical protein ACOYW3_09725 [Bacteroidota bacterium]
MNLLIRGYRWVSILSVDVAVGAAVSCWFFSRVLGVSLLPQAYLVLGITVWIIYTADHLLDAQRVKTTASSDRHRFHQNNFWALAIFAIVMLLIDLALVFFVRRPVVTTGFYFSLLVGAYMLLSGRLMYLKEFAGAFLYTGGVVLPAWTLRQEALTSDQWILISAFGMVVLLNLLLFSWMSQVQDRLDGYVSLATTISAGRMKRLMAFVLLVFSLLILLPSEMVKERVVLAGMMLTLVFVFVNHRQLQRDDFFRWLGDSIFLMPLALLLF